MRLPSLIVIALLLHRPAVAQNLSTVATLDTFRAEVLKSQFLVRGFSADPVTEFQWVDGKLVLQPPKLHVLGVLSPTSVKMSGQKIEIEGLRSILRKNAHGKFELRGNTSAVIRIALNGAAPEAVFANLRDTVFFSSADAAFAELPEERRKQLLVEVDSSPKKSKAPLPSPCPNPGAKFNQPRVVHSGDAQYSKEAEDRKYSGEVQVAFTVDKEGHPYDLWLLTDIGLGLDENAVQSVRNFRFTPATCDGVPIEIPLTMSVNFSVR